MGNDDPLSPSTLRFAKQAEKLSLEQADSPHHNVNDTTAVKARFITPQDTVIETAGGGRLPTVPQKEALELNRLRDEVEREGQGPVNVHAAQKRDDGDKSNEREFAKENSNPEAAFRTAIPPQRTHPLFPELPLYGPPSFIRNVQCNMFRISSFFLSLSFLMVIVLGSAFTSIPMMFRHIWMLLKFRRPNSRRPHDEEERTRKDLRSEQTKAWKQRKRRKSGANSLPAISSEDAYPEDEYPPLEGGADPLVCDVRYYARRVGLECEDYDVQTEDGFIISLLHIYDPKERSAKPSSQRSEDGPKCFEDVFEERSTPSEASQQGGAGSNRRYPVLLIHGLLQSAGAYCTNDDDSLAFYLHKSGFDVWLGQNRCGFTPRHTLLKPSDPRMWNWNIRQMGILDLPALISRVLSETEFSKLGLVCHSQGTTQTFVALAKGQRPDIGNKISVVCALAPAVYAGPLIGKMYFKFMRIISPSMFRIMFGIHSFIPFMMTMHRVLPGQLYGALGYRVFSFLFNWSDDRWDLGLRDRFFQFSPVYVSAESMRWWLGRECFASQKCILTTRDESRQEDREDEEEDEEYFNQGAEHATEQRIGKAVDSNGHTSDSHATNADRGRRAWYDHQVPPFALWVAGNDQLVDGRRLLRRFERGREPHVKVIHQSVIEEYEHLDVLWAIDAVEKVARPVKESLWRCVSENDRKVCRTPKGCEGLNVVI